jgi:hypothetical protein
LSSDDGQQWPKHIKALLYNKLIALDALATICVFKRVMAQDVSYKKLSFSVMLIRVLIYVSSIN